MAITSIIYTEPDQTSYEGVKVTYGDNLIKIFNTGDFVKDWYLATKFKVQEIWDSEPHFTLSSTVDHFIMDGDLYESAWVVLDENDNPKLAYVSDGVTDVTYFGSELFVEAGKKYTFEELKAKCTEN